MNMESYVEWVKGEKGVQFLYPLEIKNVVGEERGLYCSSDIPPQSSLLTLPFDFLLTSLSAQGTAIDIPTTPFEREDDLLAVLLCYERYVVGTESRWSKHIDLLPREYDSIINYRDEELEMIRGSNLYVTAVQWKKQIESDYQSLKLSRPTCPVCTSSWFTVECYKWALSTIWSRFVTIEKSGALMRCMVPYFDMLNHSPSSKVGHLFSNDKLVLRSPEGHKAEEEIFLNYGAQSNSRLLMLYGFCVANNPSDEVDLWASMSNSAPQFVRKDEALSELGIDHRQKPFKLTMQGPPNDLLTCLRIQYADNADLQRLSEARQMLSLESEKSVCSLLSSALDGMLNAYTTTIEEDEVLLREWNVVASFVPPTLRIQHCVILRCGEKKILQHCVQWIKNYLEKLSSLDNLD